ncbi:hypothetical protein LCGC14_2990490 [marine sediment metagenome]|uniref:Uncharacterized protein n=1 Tax=marine sediment metagenome TaxID=412755 RepID=A0A0F8XRI6_9ZZZZ
MKAEWATYLESIGIQKLFLKRAEEVFDFYQQVYPNQMEDIFVTEYIDEDGNEQYESLWLFSTTSAGEAKNFLQEDDFDSVPLIKQVKYWCIKKTEYDFTKATTKSRMVLRFKLLSGVSGDMKASIKNCDHLKSLFMKYILPNAIESSVLAKQVYAGDGD